MSKLEKYIVANDSKTILKIYVQPGASKNEFVGLYGDPPRLKVKIKAQPQDGEANAEVITFLAKVLKISKSKIEIYRGHISRQKDVLIDLDITEVVKGISE
jgi:uncharacterized protein (TIGR00251 family)